MKRSLLFFAALFFTFLAFGQTNLVVEAPLNNNATSINRGPNGTSAHAYLSACFLVPQADLFNMPSGVNISSFGFTLNTGVTSSPVSGNFTVYLQNTSDVSYQKGTVFGTALTGMTSAFANVMTVPAVGATSVIVTLSTPFNYTGGGLYVAYDWVSTGPFGTTGAQYLCENATLPLPGGGGAIAYSGASAQSSLTLTNIRPAFLFGFTNPNNNDIQVIGIEAPGKVAATLGLSHTIKAYVHNISNVAKSNITVSVAVSGANTFNNSQTIASLAAGAGSLVSFSAFNPLTLGINNITVSVSGDQNNLNNSATYQQSVTCDTWAQNPPTSYTTQSVGFGAGAGIIATGLYNTNANSLVAINGGVSIDPACVNQQLCGVLLSAAGAIIATTNTITVTNAMLGTTQPFTFATPQNLTGSTQYYIGFAQINPLAVTYRPAGTFSSYYIPSGLYVYTGITAGSLIPLVQNFGYFDIEAVYGSANLAIAATPTSVCAGSCATLSIGGLTSYTWSTGVSNQTISVCPAGPNSYTVLGTNTLNCPASAVISLPINPLPLMSILSNTTSVCVGGALSFTAGGAGSYTWTGGPATATYALAAPATSTTYVATGTNSNGCINTASVDISVVNLSVTVTSNTTICKGKNASLVVSAAGSGNYNYNWQIGTGLPFQTAVVAPTITTTYTVDVTETNSGCSKTSTVSVTVNPNPTVSISSSKNVICKGESAVLTASGATSYSWNNGLSVSSITVSPFISTNYIVTGTNTATGCTHSISLVQSVAPCTALPELAANNAMMRVYPNPGTGLLNISTGSAEPDRVIEVYNLLGAFIRQKELTTPETTLDLGSEPAGVYLLQLRQQNKVLQVVRVIKQ